jgi:hypothetical protein
LSCRGFKACHSNIENRFSAPQCAPGPLSRAHPAAAQPSRAACPHQRPPPLAASSCIFTWRPRPVCRQLRQNKRRAHIASSCGIHCSQMSSAAALPPKPSCGIGLVLEDGPDGVVVRSLNPLGAAAQSKADVLPNGRCFNLPCRQSSPICVTCPPRHPSLRRRQFHRNLRLCEGARARTRGNIRHPWSQAQWITAHSLSRTRAFAQRCPWPSRQSQALPSPVFQSSFGSVSSFQSVLQPIPSLCPLSQPLPPPTLCNSPPGHIRIHVYTPSCRSTAICLHRPLACSGSAEERTGALPLSSRMLLTSRHAIT